MKVSNGLQIRKRLIVILSLILIHILQISQLKKRLYTDTFFFSTLLVNPVKESIFQATADILKMPTVSLYFLLASFLNC
jgi:hypothetical protein